MGKGKALVLLSGGLDSVLAATLLRRCGLDVIGISYTSPFFGSEKAEKAAAQLDMELIVEDISEEHLEVLKNPRYGFGKNLNPCIDCHALMVRTGLRLLGELGADFIATGEVLGERPKSQNRRALDIVASLSGAGEMLLRPLSARLLPPTRPELDGIIDREELLDLQGRSRKRQMRLAAEWEIGRYESPAGGCLLTDANISDRLRELMRKWPDFDVCDASLVTLGRHNWSGDTLIVLGRKHEENERLEQLALPSDVLLRERGLPGPLALIRAHPKGSRPGEEARLEAARLLGLYGKKKAALSRQEVEEVGSPAGGT